ncbi:MAG: dienelactone hydrolase family protein [Steroidobacteraceae bacterium]
MSQSETLMARDGHTFGAYIAKPPGKARGGIVVVQEIFGVAPHVRRVADDYAAQGYLAVAPSLFDRVARGIVLGYSPAEVEQGLGYRKQIPTPKAVLDIAAAAAICRHAGRVAVLGFCWGGRLAWAAASEVPLGAAVIYYGGGIPEELPKAPHCPTILHFGTRDKSIPASDIEQLRAALPTGEFHLYDAGHAFNNDDRPQSFDAAASALARERTLAFLAQRLG